MKKMEIERRFLLIPCSVERLLKEEGVDYRMEKIEQFYLESSEQSVDRYRRIGDRYIHTRKRGAGLVREEWEEEVSREEYLEARQKVNKKRRIVKKRFVVKWKEGLSFEIDSFKEALKGLEILEMEFPDRERAEAFQLPEPYRKICIAEVTEDRRFTNGALSRTMRIPPIEEPLRKILARIDRRESFLKASVSVELRPWESGRHSLRALIHSILRSIQANREAILSGDRDPERLHQLRVAMRKLLALLGETKPLFEPDWIVQRRESLRALMTKTGKKRDLDVYLSRIDDYLEIVGPCYRDGIERLKSWLESRARESEVELKAFLRSEAFEKERKILETFSRDARTDGLSEEAVGPIFLPVKKALKRRYRKLLEKGTKLEKGSPPEAYHRVRIEVKKLRYLMEFFASVLEEEPFRLMLKRLKEIQTVLGDYQDLETQQMHLQDFTSKPELQDGETREAIERLRKELKKMAENKRGEFRKLFGTFKETKPLLRRMICRY
ncbi:CHAD domain-containing protein [Nitratifractor sp.]